MEITLLKDIIVICGLALSVIFVCQRCSIPSIVGLLITGILAGPHGLRLVSELGHVEHMAEIGVVCLLFTIGLEFSLKSLLEIKFLSLVGGGVQVAISIFVAGLIAGLLGLPLSQAVFFGFLVSLSSTAIVLKILQERAEMESPHGRLTLGILLFQDIMVVPMMLIAPILASGGRDVLGALLLLGKAVALLSLVIFVGKWIIPSALYQIARLRGREFFILGIVFVGLSVAWLTAQAGLSLALGAFFAGLIVSESEYAHHTLGNVIPFRDLFTSFFFVSVGMLFNLHFVLENPALLVGLTGGVVALKFIAAAVAATVLGLPLRTALLTGFALAQIGEFSFVLSESGTRLGLIQAENYQVFLGISVLTMLATPFLIGNGERVAVRVLNLPLPERFKSGLRPVREIQGDSPLNNHLIIVGFGLTGRNLSRATAAAGIPRVIVELNPDTVRRQQAKGEPIIYGDASQEAVIEHAAVKRARVMVIVISDPIATNTIVHAARRLNPKLYIIARTRFISQIEPLYEVGADEAIPEEYEASIEVLVRVLARYLVPRGDVERLVAEFRADHYRMLRTLTRAGASLADLALHLPDAEIASLRVGAGSKVTEKSLSELDFRSAYGVTVLAIKRDSIMIPNPPAEEKFQESDVALILGAPDRIAEAADLFRGATDSRETE